MLIQTSQPRRRWKAAVLVLFGILLPSTTEAAVSYTYDQLGRITTALYDNGLCIVYTYDANGNRTSQTNSASGAPQTPTWGTGVWGCFVWTPQ
jgi:hypothetical protein